MTNYQVCIQLRKRFSGWQHAYWNPFQGLLSKGTEKELILSPVSIVRDCLGTWSTQLWDISSSMRERVDRGQVPTDIKYDSKVSWAASNKDLLLITLLDLMDHISGTNKKMFLWIEGGGSSVPRIKKEGPGPTLPPSPTHLLVLERSLQGLQNN